MEMQRRAGGHLNGWSWKKKKKKNGGCLIYQRSIGFPLLASRDFGYSYCRFCLPREACELTHVLHPNTERSTPRCDEEDGRRHIYNGGIDGVALTNYDYLRILPLLPVIYCTSSCPQGTNQSEQATSGVVQAVSFYLFIHALKGRIDWNKLPAASVTQACSIPSIYPHSQGTN
jgi:hypothetical protein